MALNYIWIAFFLVAFVIALIKLVFLGDTEIFPALFDSTVSMSKTGFELSLFLTGIMSLWLGIMKIGERGGIIDIFNKLFGPFFRKLFPEIPEKHPAMSAMLMNITANMLGLDNAATPLGIKAMEEMQTLNPHKDTASNSQIMFLVLNTSGLTIIPISVIVFREQMNAADPTDVFIPILLATFFASMAGLISVAIYQKINLFNKTIIAYIGSMALLIGVVIYYFSTLEKEAVQTISSVASNFIIFSIIVFFISLAAIKKVNVYEAFIEGATDGFKVAVKIIPFLVAMLVAIGVFRASGAFDLIMAGLEAIFSFLGFNTDFVPSLPTAMMRPLSGSAARGMMLETMQNYGADSFAGRLASITQGTTETTFYVIAVYFGAVKIRKTRYAITCGLIADFVGILAAILLGYLFFH